MSEIQNKINQLIENREKARMGGGAEETHILLNVPQEGILISNSAVLGYGNNYT